MAKENFNPSKKNKIFSLISILFGIIASIGFMCFWQIQGCPSPEYYDYIRKTMNFSDWLEYFEKSTVFWVPGVLISTAILIAFIVLAIILKRIRFIDKSKINAQNNIKKPNILLIIFITFAIALFIIWLVGVTFFGWNDNANKSSSVNYKTCAMCGDRVPEDDMRGSWCKDCQNDAFGEDGWYNKIKD